jgi:hypothetical protein
VIAGLVFAMLADPSIACCSNQRRCRDTPFLSPTRLLVSWLEACVASLVVVVAGG